MGWAKFDDQFTDHPKVVQAGPMGELLAMRAVIHCARYETDGHVQAALLPRLAIGIPSPRKHVNALVKAGLWEPDSAGDGWWVHDFLEYHPTAEEQRRKRDEARERMANRRAKKTRTTSSGSAGVRANTERTSGEVREKFNDPVPDPAVPNGTDAPRGAAPPVHNAKTLIAAHVSALPQRPPRQVVDRLGTRVAQLLADGIPPHDIVGALELLRAKPHLDAAGGCLASLVEEHRGLRRTDDEQVANLEERRLAGASSYGRALAGELDRQAALARIHGEYAGRGQELVAAAVAAYDHASSEEAHA